MQSIEESLNNLENQVGSLIGTDHEDDTKEAKFATFKKAYDDLSDEEKKQARKAMDDEEEKKQAMDDDEHEKQASDDDSEKDAKRSKRSKKSKKSMDDDDDTSKDEKIASLTASLEKMQSDMAIMQSKPRIEQMLKARLDAGMPAEQVKAFEKTLYGKSISEIKKRYDEDKALFASTSATPSYVKPEEEIPFYEGSLVASAAGTTVEEMLK